MLQQVYENQMRTGSDILFDLSAMLEYIDRYIHSNLIARLTIMIHTYIYIYIFAGMSTQFDLFDM